MISITATVYKNNCVSAQLSLIHARPQSMWQCFSVSPIYIQLSTDDQQQLQKMYYIFWKVFCTQDALRSRYIGIY